MLHSRFAFQISENDVPYILCFFIITVNVVYKNPPLTVLRQKRNISSNYTGDLYLQERTFNIRKNDVLDTVEQFDSLEFISHPGKSAFSTNHANTGFPRISSILG